MSSAAEILVVILSIFLAFFLALAIALTIYLIKLTRQIRKITDSAERTANVVETLVNSVNKMISPLMVADIVSKIIRGFKSKKGNK